MKKILVIVAAVFSSLAVTAQTMNVHFKDNTTTTLQLDDIDHIDFTEQEVSEPAVGEYVDLGLSVKWVTCNLGAAKPSEMGSEYAWGETSAKSEYTRTNYAYYDSDTESYVNIGDDISGTLYDAATVKLGKGWRMPTYKEMDELSVRCEWKWSQTDGVDGYLVTGPNGNSIFMPHEKGNVFTFYWTATLRNFERSDASCFYFTQSKVLGPAGDFTYLGHYIRPVYSPVSENR